MKSDVVVIGAGIIGSSIAYHLAQRKASVILVEKADLAAGSSGACDGLIFLQSKKPGIHLQLAMESRKRFARLRNSLPVAIEYRESGGMVIIESDEELAVMQEFVKEQQKIGLDVTLLNADRARQLEPHLSEHIIGATHSPLDGQVNPIALTLGFAMGAKNLGARLITGATVRGIDTTAGRVSAVESDTGRFEADIVVNAAGTHAPEIGTMVGLSIPIKPRRGQIIVTEACPPMLNHCMVSAKYIAAKFSPEIAKAGGEGISIEQTETGNFLLGSTREFVGYDKRTTTNGLQRIAAKTAGIIPALEQVNVIRAFAGLRPYTPDGLPILGQVADVPGFFMAAGHEGDGIALSPITGELIAQMIVTGKSDFPLDAFRISRFNVAREDVEVAHG
ncbi:MAG: FAD-dependent oxidoreductase [Desulfobacterales bacterium]|jgi:sarcosine oxidase subunit beta